MNRKPLPELLLAERLVRSGQTLATAESCTGGLIGHRVTSVSGCSAYYLGGVIAYAYRVKIDELGVDPVTLDREGAVSPTVAGQMARGVRERLGADIGVGTTGIAGPTGGTADKPVGLVYMAVCDGRGCRVERHTFKGGREAVKDAAAEAALRLILHRLDAVEADGGEQKIDDGP